MYMQRVSTRTAANEGNEITEWQLPSISGKQYIQAF
jgi:hypothetical protein